MNLSDQQYAFAKDLIQLLEYIRDNEEIDKFSIGEVWRPLPWQKILYKKGYSKTLQSDHINKMAVDLYFWIDGQFVKNKWENKKKLQEIGEVWKGLSKQNYWGGYYKTFCDLPHFGRKQMTEAINDTD